MTRDLICTLPACITFLYMAAEPAKFLWSIL